MKRVLLMATACCFVWGQSALCASDFPSMPSIDSPSMPSLSAPASRPSVPWRGSAPYVPSQQPLQQEKAGESASDSAGTTEKTDKAQETVAGLALTAQSISGLGGLEALSGLGGLGSLTGISGLDSLSGLDALKGLDSLLKIKDEDELQEYLLRLAGQSPADAAEAAKTASSATPEAPSAESAAGSAAKTTAPATAASPEEAAPQETVSSETTTLQQILEKLEELAAAKEAEKKASEAAPTPNSQKTGNLSPSRILRFRANATDVLPSCTTVYFSQPDPAGIFLLTGDRIVKAGGKDRNETFYFLFTPTLDEDGSFIYKVESQLMQDWTSERSELYPLASGLPLTATRTGNLVTLRHSASTWNLDLLLDLRE